MVSCVALKNGGQQVEGSYPSPPSLAMLPLIPFLGSSPAEGYRDDLGPENLLSEERLGDRGLFGLKKGRIQGNLRATFLYLEGVVRKKETYSLEGSVVMGQWEMVSNEKRGDLDWI